MKLTLLCARLREIYEEMRANQENCGRPSGSSDFTEK
jgi:hypothetical protein